MVYLITEPFIFFTGTSAVINRQLKSPITNRTFQLVNCYNPYSKPELIRQKV